MVLVDTSVWISFLANRPPFSTQLVRHRGLQGRGVGWIDIHLLASAIVGRLRLWTADPRFAALARELGVAYDVLGSQAEDS